MDSLGYECIVRGIRRGAKPTRRGSDGGETRVEPELRNGRAVERRRRENPGMEESVSSGRDGHLGGPVAFGATRGGARRDVACLRARIRKRARVSVSERSRAWRRRARRAERWSRSVGELAVDLAPRASMGCSVSIPSGAQPSERRPTGSSRRRANLIKVRSAPTDASRGASGGASPVSPPSVIPSVFSPPRLAR